MHHMFHSLIQLEQFQNHKLNLIEEFLKENLHAHYNLAAIYTDWGRNDQAFSHLRRACAIGPVRVRDWLSDDRMFEKLRADGRFSELLKVDPAQDSG